MAQIIDGKLIAKNLQKNIRKQVEQYVAQGLRKPGLSVILVGNDPASQIYVRNKGRACEKAGFKSTIYRLAADIAKEDLLDLIFELNQDSAVDGILCQLPLPKHLPKQEVIEAIDPAKDVDGFHPVNSGRLFSGIESLLPCTAAGIIRMLKSIDYQFTGKKALVIGRSNIVGKPTAILLLNENCTVTIAHSKTQNLAELSRQADLLITSAGKENFITPEFTNPEQIIIDVSINRNATGKVVGDVDFAAVEPLVRAITPVPGGVGPMTIAVLLENTLVAYRNHLEKK
ncbi:MAG TPA: bifunctional methylenetetrahydrofolate dehydrogenase/methenyltetrahydrofolate cyclohydrolase FolD [Clostridiaceae bacterium]|nr:bifunctional methylenetetrahydrofolate dehydrogenase/methenyltetrahydrofolate cyclohydrolase FolD [Clostridiaceae bacterium]